MSTFTSIFASSLKSFAIAGAFTVIAFLGVSSQVLFRSLDPHPPTSNQSVTFNALVVCVLVSYIRLLWTSPGYVPLGRSPVSKKDGNHAGPETTGAGRRWCPKCETYKPPRGHHCKICNRCVLKMDHHCPWTKNCIAHRTLPHYIRFQFFAVVTLTYLESFLYERVAAIWEKRNMPYYHGPSVLQIVHLIVLGLVTSFTLFAISILFIRSVWSLGENITTIEGWEIERHKALLRRARALGGYLNGPGGTRIRLVKQEFPYDIGIWSNLAQGMGTPIAWFWPFSASPSPETGFNFEVNGFEDENTHWPPPDPDRMITKKPIPSNRDYTSDYWDSAGFNQANTQTGKLHPRLPQQNKSRHTASKGLNNRQTSENDATPWRNWEGETLDDFGVDEGVDVYIQR